MMHWRKCNASVDVVKKKPSELRPGGKILTFNYVAGEGYLSVTGFSRHLRM